MAELVARYSVSALLSKNGQTAEIAVEGFAPVRLRGEAAEAFLDELFEATRSRQAVDHIVGDHWRRALGREADDG